MLPVKDKAPAPVVGGKKASDSPHLFSLRYKERQRQSRGDKGTKIGTEDIGKIDHLFREGRYSEKLNNLERMENYLTSSVLSLN